MLNKLPLPQLIETPKVLKKAISANRALAKLNGVAKIIPNSQILINSQFGDREYLITTHDELFRAELDISPVTNEIKEMEHYRQALLKGYALVQEHKLLLKRDIIAIQRELEQNDAGVRRHGYIFGRISIYRKNTKISVYVLNMSKKQRNFDISTNPCQKNTKNLTQLLTYVKKMQKF